MIPRAVALKIRQLCFKQLFFSYTVPLSDQFGSKVCVRLKLCLMKSTRFLHRGQFGFCATHFPIQSKQKICPQARINEASLYAFRQIGHFESLHFLFAVVAPSSITQSVDGLFGDLVLSFMVVSKRSL